MANEYSADVPKGFNVPKQVRLDSITGIQNEETLKDLGVGNNLAFKYYEGLEIYCKDEKTTYRWREVVGSETGLLDIHFVYPNYNPVDGIDYSGKSFNFFEVTDSNIQPPDGSETKLIEGSNITIIGTGTALDPYEISSTSGPSQTYIEEGNNVTITGTGVELDPYIINSDSEDLGIVKTVNNEVIAPGQSISIINNETTGKVLTTKEYVQSVIPATPDGSETKLNAGDNVTILGTGTTLDPYIINAESEESITYVNSGDNTNVTGSGSISDPYIINSIGVQFDDLANVATSGEYSDLLNTPSTKSEFNTELTDGDFLFTGDITQYTNEQAQDAVGNILIDTPTINFTYDDENNTIIADVKPSSINTTHLADNINVSKFVNDSDYATKAYADSLVTSIFRPAGDWDASGNTFPTTGTGPGDTIRSGDTYNTSVAGTPSGFETLDVGDNFYALIDNPGQTPANWKVFESNTQQATESFRGTAKIATQATIENVSTTNNIDIVTPSKFYLGWEKIKTIAQTFLAKITFAVAPRFNSGTANTLLYLDSNKDLASSTVTPTELEFLSGIDGNIQDQIDIKTTLSAGAFSGFAVTNNGDGTISVGSGIAYLRATNDQYAPLIKYPIAAYSNIPLVDNLNNYIVVSYNGGSPALVLNTTGTGIDTQTTSIAIAAARVGTTVHYVSLVGSNSDPNAKLRNRYLQSEGIRRVAGLAISATGRKIATTAGITYSGLIRLDVAAMNTNTSDTYTLAYNNGSTWTRVTGQTDINNTQYNNAGTLTALSNNNFRTDYIYALVNSPSKLFVILGNTQYNTIGAARLAPTPSSLPVELEQLGVLVGRAIIEKDAVTMEMASPFVQDFAAGAIENHNDLAGLQGGTAGEYNHLTDAQVSLVNGASQKQNFINIKDLGGIGDGVFDNTAIVNNALLTYKEVYFPDGNYLVTSLVNDLGSKITGSGIIVKAVTGGVQQLNTGIDRYNYVFGQEYLSAFQKKILDRPDITTNIKISWSGDSTTEGTSVSPDYVPSVLFSETVKKESIPNLSSLNRGHSGQNTEQWRTLYLASDLSENPDLYIIRWGINDPAYGRSLSDFETSLRTALETLRATKTQAQMSVILMSPNSTSDTPNARDEKWYEQVRNVYMQAARDYQCAFIDTYSLWLDSRNGAADLFMDNPYGDGRAIHPLGIMNTWIVSKVFDLCFPDSFLKKVSKGNFVNEYSVDKTPPFSNLPASYNYGTTLSRAFGASIGGTFEVDGMISTSVQSDGIAYQFNTSRSLTSPELYFRTSVGDGMPMWSDNVKLWHSGNLTSPLNRIGETNQVSFGTNNPASNQLLTLRSTPSYGYNLGFENQNNTQNWALVVDTGAVDDGIFGIADRTNSKVLFQIYPDTGVTKLFSLAGGNERVVSANSQGELVFSNTPAAPTAPVGTNTTQIATTAFVQSAISSSSSEINTYKARLVQSGTGNPVATVFKNTLGTSIAWSRTSAGLYEGTTTGGLPDNYTFVMISNEDSTRNVSAYRGSSSSIVYQVTDFTESGVDGEVVNIMIEVYPVP